MVPLSSSLLSSPFNRRQRINYCMLTHTHTHTHTHTYTYTYSSAKFKCTNFSSLIFFLFLFLSFHLVVDFWLVCDDIYVFAFFFMFPYFCFVLACVSSWFQTPNHRVFDACCSNFLLSSVVASTASTASFSSSYG